MNRYPDATRPLLGLALVALGCQPDRPLGPPSPAVWVQDTAPLTLEVLGDDADFSPGQAWVRGRNGLRATAMAGPRTITVNGEPQGIEVGPWGYAQVPIPGQGSHRVGVPGAAAWVHVYGAPFDGFGLADALWAPIHPQGDAVAAGEGVLAADGVSLWWIGAAGRPHEVLRLERAVAGVVAGHLDGDGVLDAAVWSDRSIHLLRGRPGGGMLYAGQLRSATHTVAAVAIGDASGDHHPDLAITWIGGPTAGRLDVWEGDGLLHFDPLPTRALDLRPAGVAIGDPLGTGWPEVTVVRLDGNWDRFGRGQHAYVPTGPMMLLDLDPTSALLTPQDLNGDGTDELLVVAPRQEGASRAIRLLDLREDLAQMITLDRPAAHLALADVDGDGRSELLLHDAAGTLSVVRAPEGGPIRSQALGTTGATGPIAAFPHSSRALLLTEPAWRWLDLLPGEATWALGAPALVAPGLTVPGGVFALQDLDEDGTAEVIALHPVAPGTRLLVSSVGPDGATPRGGLDLDPEPKPLLDIAVCGEHLHALIEGSVHRVRIADPDAPVQVASAPVDGHRVACGAGSGGAAVAVLGPQTITLFDAALAVVGDSPAAGAADLLLGPEGVSTCDRVGCVLERGPVGPDGASVEVAGWPGGASIDGQPVPAAGIPTLGDVDGNGAMDVVFHDSGRLVVLRHTGDRLGSPRVLDTGAALGGRLGIADLDGDGRPDAWGVEPENDRLRVTPGG